MLITFTIKKPALGCGFFLLAEKVWSGALAIGIVIAPADPVGFHHQGLVGARMEDQAAALQAPDVFGDDTDAAFLQKFSGHFDVPVANAAAVGQARRAAPAENLGLHILNAAALLLHHLYELLVTSYE